MGVNLGETRRTFLKELPIPEVTFRRDRDAYVGCGYSVSNRRYIGWKFNGKDLLLSDRYTPGFGNKGLEIKNAQPSDSGIYTCTVEDEFTGEVAQDDIKLTIHPGNLNVVVWPLPPKVYKTVGGDFVVICVVDDLDPGSELESISWFDSEGRNLSMSTSRRESTYMKGSRNSQLHLKNLRSADAGKYTCRVKTSIGEVTSVKDVHIELELYEKPETVISTKDVAAYPSEYVILGCAGQTENNLAIAWEHNGKDLYNEMLLKMEDYFTIEDDLRLMSHYYANYDGLHIIDVHPDPDGGIYRCRVKDETTEVITDQIFNLTITPDIY